MSGISQAGFLEVLGWAILNSLWQMAMLWLVFQIISGVVLNNKASQKSSLATVFLLTGFAWFLFTFFSILYNPLSNTGLITDGLTGIPKNDKLLSILQQTLPAAAVVYMVLLLFPVYRFWKNYHYLKIIRNQGLSKINVEWSIFTWKHAAIMGIKRKVAVLVSEFVTSPVTIGFLRPMILLPIAALNNLTTQQVEALLIHELAHIKRHDYFINLLINGIRTILYFNPFVTLFIKTIEREREKSCDEMVIQFRNDPLIYASALMELGKATALKKSFVVAAFGNKNDLLSRIEKILGISKKPVLPYNKLAGWFAGFVIAIGFYAVLALNRPLSVIQTNTNITQPIISSPFHQLIDDYALAYEKQQETKYPVANLHVENASNSKQKIKPIEHTNKVSEAKPVFESQGTLPLKKSAFPLVNVNQKTYEVIPQLKDYQELQVKKAMDASKRIIEEMQWKNIEKTIADAFTRGEKEKIRSLNHDAFENQDWHKWEDKIRLAYKAIDWEKINEEIGTSLSKIKLDSIHNIYLEAASTLEFMISGLKENNLTGIPDTDITLKQLEQSKQRVQLTLNTISNMRTRKIIRL